ncbi:cytidylate kinase-like family protein [Christensenellaceae bacterium OttesenSCG-928-L17]|nr:cytidylate kinase-like family protein [Christensenellaceae bacterium OttesenSCG-928-L17]
MKPRIVTISRQFGSGGRTIGEMLAKELNVAFYDKRLIAMVAKESGLALEFIEETGEYSSTNSYLFNMYMSVGYNHSGYAPDVLSPADRVHIVQSNLIRAIAEKEPCVIVGRSADYILQEREDCLNVFIHADIEYRVNYAVAHYDVPAADAKKRIERIDKTRANHYRHYTGQQWGVASHYHIALDSGKLGLTRCRDIIAAAARGDDIEA